MVRFRKLWKFLLDKISRFRWSLIDLLSTLSDQGWLLTVELVLRLWHVKIELELFSTNPYFLVILLYFSLNIFWIHTNLRFKIANNSSIDSIYWGGSSELKTAKNGKWKGNENTIFRTMIRVGLLGLWDSIDKSYWLRLLFRKIQAKIVNKQNVVTITGQCSFGFKMRCSFTLPAMNNLTLIHKVTYYYCFC